MAVLNSNGQRELKPAANAAVYAVQNTSFLGVPYFGAGLGRGDAGTAWGLAFATWFGLRGGLSSTATMFTIGSAQAWTNNGVYHDCAGALLGQVTLNSVGVAYARVHLFLRSSGAWIGSATCDASGNYGFYGLDRQVLSDSGYLVVGFQPNGAGTQYDAQAHDRLIPG